MNDIVKVVIVEDERNSVMTLEWLMKTLFPDKLKLVGVFGTVPDAVDGIQKLEPDLVLLDIELDGDNCFSLLEQLQPVGFEIIFTTAYSKYMERALTYCSIAFLLKPIAVPDFRQAILLAEPRIKKTRMAKQVEALMHNLQLPEGNAVMIGIPVVDGLEFIDTSEIIWCEGAGSYTTLHLPGKKELVSSQHLSYFEDLLTDCNFHRIHNSYLINLAEMKSYTRGRGGTVKMSDGTELEVAVRSKEEFLKRTKKVRWWRRGW